MDTGVEFVLMAVLLGRLSLLDLNLKFRMSDSELSKNLREELRFISPTRLSSGFKSETFDGTVLIEFRFKELF